MTQTLTVGSLSVDVEFKSIKNIHLSVHPPSGKVRVSAPKRMKLDTIQVFVASRLGWIRQQQRKLAAQKREPLREFKDRESHYLWGERYLLKVIEKDESPSVTANHKLIQLQVRPGSDVARKDEIMQEWYRNQIRQELPALLQKWESTLGVKVNHVYIQRMKTRWGGCTPRVGNIRLNTELAKKPWECLEYIVVHELVHLLEPTHNDSFVALMNKCLPTWKQRRNLLNQLPVRQEEWKY